MPELFAQGLIVGFVLGAIACFLAMIVWAAG